jgi:hypothetical protein
MIPPTCGQVPGMMLVQVSAERRVFHDDYCEDFLPKDLVIPYFVVWVVPT